MGHGRADKAGPSLARDVAEASAVNGLAQSIVPTFLKQRKYFMKPQPGGAAAPVTDS